MCLKGWNTIRERLTWNKSNLNFILKEAGRSKDFKQGSDVVRLLTPFTLSTFPSMPNFNENYTHFSRSHSMGTLASLSESMQASITKYQRQGSLEKTETYFSQFRG